jgi:CubicO group peptidase (beta-lactamase class C family)
VSDLSTLRGVVRVERDGALILESAHGLADETSMLPCTPDVRFQLASVSKQFAAAAVLLLAQDQRLSVDDPVAQWIHGCPPSWRSMTIRHLLTHTSGLPHWHDIPAITLTSHMDPATELSLIQGAPMTSLPGEQWSYSSPGYWILAAIVQRAADRPYADVLVERIFQPLGLASMFVGNAGARVDVAADHVGGMPVATFELDVVGMGAGDVWSTAADVLKWDRALMEESLLRVPERDMMFAQQAVVNDPTSTRALTVDGYGFGWFIGSSYGHRAFLHGGDNAGSVSLNVVLPDDDLRLVVLSNEGSTHADHVAIELLEPLLGRD